MEVGVMPKEVIVRSEPDVVHPAAEGTEEHPASEGSVWRSLGLSVGWNKAGWMQVYMEPHESEHTGQWHIVDLTREQCNQMIRALRKARDQAFGRDA